MARGILCLSGFLITAIAVEVVVAAQASEPEYECIDSPMKLNASQVCDGEPQCPLHDDEYHCSRVSGSCAGTQVDGTCCQDCCTEWPCLTNATDEKIKCFKTDETGEDFLNITSEYWRKCDWHREHKQALRCERNLKTCPWGCKCCPHLIICNATSWSRLHKTLKEESRVSVKILKIEHLSEASDRNWTEIAELMPFLRRLEVRGTDIQSLQPAEFAPFKYLDMLVLNGNGITDIDRESFKGLSKLTILALEGNKISSFSNASFSDLTDLRALSLYDNPIMDIAESAWEGLGNLYKLRLDETKIVQLTNTTFRFLSNLEVLSVQNTELTTIQPGAFVNTPSISRLELQNNKLQKLSVGTFDGLQNCEELAIGKTLLKQIETGAFRNLSSVIILFLFCQSNLQLNRHMFEGLDNKSLSMYVDNPGICCIVNKEIGENESEPCKLSGQVALDFTTCASLLPNILNVFIWIMAIASILGNILVIFLRYRRRNESASQNVQRILILNLAISDILMGIYMLIIGATDVNYGSDYFWYTDVWRESDLCKVAGFLALISSETSIFIITAISIDRFLILVFPFGKIRLRGKVLHICIILMWGVSFLISTIGIASPNEKLYGQSSVCIGLPLITRYRDTSGHIKVYEAEPKFVLKNTEKEPAWVFSIVIFLCINFICLMIVVICYVAIFISVIKSRENASRDANRQEEVTMAVKMLVIVGTDFCCWMPVVIMGIISQSGLVEISSEAYAWLIVFVLPINSAINPYLYTINGATDWRRRYHSDKFSYRSTVAIRLSRLMSVDSHNNSRTPSAPSPSVSPKKGNNNANYSQVNSSDQVS